jgi:hypothetical protein
MAQWDIYGQAYFHGVAIGYDDQEGLTVTFFQQGSVFLAGADAWFF